MTTLNEDLILKLRGQAYTTCRPDQLCDQAADLLQSLSERIAMLEFLNELAVKQAETLVKQRDTLRAQLAAIAATEPVATINDLSNSRMFTLEANGYSRKDKLFTHPMPAQDVTELVDALEMIVSTHQGHCKHYFGVSKHSHNLADIAEEALSKYKGVK